MFQKKIDHFTLYLQKGFFTQSMAKVQCIKIFDISKFS